MTDQRHVPHPVPASAGGPASPVPPNAPASGPAVAPPPTAPAPYGTAAPTAQPMGPSDKSFIATWLLSWLLGGLGVDRFYLGKIGTGIVKLITLGGLGVWSLIDLILVLAGATRDKQGRRLAGFEQHRVIAWAVTGAVVVLSIIIAAVSGGGASSSPADESAPAVEEPVAEAPAEVGSDEAEPQPPAEPAPVVDEPAEESNAAGAWVDSSFGTFEAENHSGSGDDLITLPAGATGGVVTTTYDGGGHFAVKVLDATNTSTGDLLVNTVGSYSGATAWGITSLGEGVTLEVTADGPWNISVEPFSAAPALTGNDAGTGDAVFLYEGAAGKLAATHAGEGHFAVTEENDELFSMGLLINEIGSYSGTVPLGAGPSIVTVTADGDWTLEIS